MPSPATKTFRTPEKSLAPSGGAGAIPKEFPVATQDTEYGDEECDISTAYAERLVRELEKKLADFEVERAMFRLEVQRHREERRHDQPRVDSYGTHSFNEKPQPSGFRHVDPSPPQGVTISHGPKPDDLTNPNYALGSNQAIGGSKDAEPRRYAGKPRKFPNFSQDTPHPSEWISEVEAYSDTYFADPQEQLIYVTGLLERDIKNELKVRTNIAALTPAQLFRYLREVFGDPLTPRELKLQFAQRKQGPKESVKEFASALVDFMVQIREDANMQHAESEAELKTQFASSCREVGLKHELKRLNREQPRLTFPQLRQQAVEWEEDQGSSPVQKKGHQNRSKAEVVETADPTQAATSSEAWVPYKTRLDRIEKQLEDLSSRIPTPQDGTPDSKPEKKKPYRSNKGSRFNKSRKQKSDKQCKYCGIRGHTEEECNFKKRAAKRLNDDSSPRKEGPIQESLNGKGTQ